MGFKEDFSQLKFALDTAVKHKVGFNPIEAKKAMMDYDLSQKRYYQQSLEKALKQIRNSPISLQGLRQENAVGQEKLNALIELIPSFDTKDIEELQKLVKKIEGLMRYISFPDEIKGNVVRIPKKIPSEIREEVLLDLKEIEKCYKNECYRSCVILCGRVLETCLHRKYFEVTGNDALEKSPGIGLGNLIAKLKEKNVELDPALTNQIHLVNQVRIFSVHVKQEPFYPSQQQTQAMVLYTMDIVEKLF